eukprot:2047252-Prymnesium_polylepis.1
MPRICSGAHLHRVPVARAHRVPIARPSRARVARGRAGAGGASPERAHHAGRRRRAPAGRGFARPRRG